MHNATSFQLERHDRPESHSFAANRVAQSRDRDVASERCDSNFHNALEHIGIRPCRFGNDTNSPQYGQL